MATCSLFWLEMVLHLVISPRLVVTVDKTPTQHEWQKFVEIINHLFNNATR